MVNPINAATVRYALMCGMAAPLAVAAGLIVPFTYFRPTLEYTTAGRWVGPVVAVGSIAVAVATVAAVFSAIGFRAVVLAGIDRLSGAAALSACIAIGVVTGGLATLLMALLAGAGSDAFHPVLVALYVPGMLAGGVCGSLLPRFLRESRANPR